VCEIVEKDFGIYVNVHFSILALFILPFMFCIFQVYHLFRQLEEEESRNVEWLSKGASLQNWSINV
jgi:hypothetical protein